MNTNSYGTGDARYLLALRIVQVSLAVDNAIEDVGEFHRHFNEVGRALHIYVRGQRRVRGSGAPHEGDAGLLAGLLEERRQAIVSAQQQVQLRSRERGDIWNSCSERQLQR